MKCNSAQAQRGMRAVSTPARQRSGILWLGMGNASNSLPTRLAVHSLPPLSPCLPQLSMGVTLPPSLLGKRAGVFLRVLIVREYLYISCHVVVVKSFVGHL